MNNKGFTVIELTISLSIISFFMIVLLSIPTGLLKEYKEYNTISDIVSDESALRHGITKDSGELGITIEEDKIVFGGNKYYTFKDNGVYRSDGNLSEIRLTKNPYNFEVVNDILTISNKDSKLIYNINSGFDKYEGGN